VDDVGVEDEDEGVAVGVALRHVVGADDAGGAGAVLDDELLPQRLRELGRQEPGERIDRAAGRIGRDELHDPFGPGLRKRRKGDGKGKDKGQKTERRHSLLLELLGRGTGWKVETGWGRRGYSFNAQYSPVRS